MGLFSALKGALGRPEEHDESSAVLIRYASPDWAPEAKKYCADLPIIDPSGNCNRWNPPDEINKGWMVASFVMLVGSTFSDRQETIASLALGERLWVFHEQHNPHDKNAVLILTADGDEIGHLPREQAAEFAPKIDACESGWTAFVAEVHPPHDRYQYAVKIWLCEPRKRNAATRPLATQEMGES
ncbi:MAG: hypothetical protein HGA39_04060 [Coriobacteriia bacterium]|nr:hypothetical protein [Coriobacteriia bacterium]